MNMVTMSFGYAVQVSPMHTLMLYNAIANNGKMMKPYLVNSISQGGLVVKKFEPTVLETSISKPSVIKAAQEGLEAVIKEGTGRRVFQDMPFPVAGKTGTAHVSDAGINYGHGIYQASFAGYFPADAPQYTCIVVIRSKPHAANHFGGTLAAPVFKAVATKLYSKFVYPKTPRPFDMAKDSSQYAFAGQADAIRQVYTQMGWRYSDSIGKADYSSVFAKNQNTIAKPITVSSKLVPDVKGMALKDALYLLESLGARVQVRGKGKVKQQSVSAGSALQKGTPIVLELGI